ncbi:GGDEF domain-containing protein [Sandaracinobacteroides sp. A072]|uniref:GGDEF domain-containing protein n=1 Tax=Sandaracinobacteroides sp. A072 TaxID=3461146 RepID=UPI004042E1FB
MNTALMLAALAAVLLAGLCLILLRRIRALEAMTGQDQLTGIANRRALEARWASKPGARALILIDLVGFKAVNDTHGHIVGDALLRQVAIRLSEAIGPSGFLARWGGDEFVALVPRQEAEAALERIRAAGLSGYDLGGGPVRVHVGARTGLSPGAPSLEAALLEADRLLLDTRQGNRRGDIVEESAEESGHAG